MEGVRRRRRADGVAGLQSHRGVTADAVRERALRRRGDAPLCLAKLLSL